MKNTSWIALLFLLLGCQENKPTDDQIFNEYYTPYLEYTSFKSKEATLEKQLNEGLTYYLAQNYEAAFDRFSIILEAYIENQITATFYAALCLIEMEVSSPEQKEIVESLLIDTINQNRNPFIREAEWYLSLFYFKNFDGEKALPLLENLAKTKGTFQVESQAILAKVK